MNEVSIIFALMILVGFGSELARHFMGAIKLIFKEWADRQLARYNTEVLDAALDAACYEISAFSDYDSKTIREQYIKGVHEGVEKCST